MTAKELQVINILHYFSAHPWVMVLFYALAAWALVWKGIASWKASRNNQTAWFVVMLVVNTLGILEIIYIFFFSKKKDKPVA